MIPSGRIVVLGGGITGLTVAYRLMTRGRDVILFEEDRRVGGCIRSERADGFLIERGPNSILSTAATDRLAADLGLQGRVVTGARDAKRHIVRYGRAIPLRPGLSAVVSPILSLPAKLRLLGDLFLPSPDVEDMSIEQYFTHRFGAEVARYLAGPFVSGVYAGDPAELSVRSAFTKLWHADRTYRVGAIRGFTRMRKEQRSRGVAPYLRQTRSLRGGLSELCEAMAARLGDAVRTGVGVDRIERCRDGPGWRLHLTDGEASAAPKVVAALPADRLASLLRELAPDAVEPLQGIPTVSVATLSLAYPLDAMPSPPEGFGTLIPRGEGFRILGCLYMSSLFPERAPAEFCTLTSFVGGALDPEACGLSNEELVRVVHQDLVRLLGAKVEPRLLALTRWPKGIPQYTLGHHERIARIEEAIRPLEGLELLGNWKDGVALADRVEAAERAADRLRGSHGT